MKLNKIYNADCLKTMEQMKENSVNYSFTSPPYNRKRNDKYSNYNDDVKDWFEWQCQIINELLRVTEKHVFYNIQANYYNRQDVYKIIGKYSEKIKDIFIWEKSNPMPASGKSITNAVEYFIILGDKPLKSNTTYTKNILTTSVNSKMPKNHKAVMKLEVAEFFIRKFTNENEIVFDCFMGVGTTARACKKLNRNYLGCEKIKEYYEMSKEALKCIKYYQSQYTQKPKKNASQL